MSDSYKVLLISDMHCGAYAGLCPPEVKIVDSIRGNEMVFNPTEAQRKLYDFWTEMCEAQHDVDLVVVNGDTCDGMNFAEGGTHVITNDMYAQAEMAAELLSMIDCDTFLVTVGSGYHSRTGKNGTAVEGYLAKALERRLAWAGRSPDVRFHPEALVKYGGKRFHVSHTVGTSSTQQYRATALMRDMTNMKLNSDWYKFGSVDMIIRGHAHFYISIDLSDIQGVITPGWKLRDSFNTKVGINVQPDIGYVVLEWGDDDEHIRVTPCLGKFSDTACVEVDYNIGPGAQGPNFPETPSPWGQMDVPGPRRTGW